MPVIQLPNVTQFSVPIGTIQIWAGTIATIPNGWALCDGVDSRPNLLDRFVRGVNTNVTNPGIIGGVETVLLTEAQMASHRHTPLSGPHDHTIPKGTGNGTTGIKVGTVFENNGLDLGDQTDPIVVGSGFTANTGGNTQHDNIPPFFEVAYIIKEND